MKYEEMNKNTLDIYLNVVNTAIANLCAAGTTLRPDVIEAVKRKWVASLKRNMQLSCSTPRDSNPRSVTKRVEYTTRPDLVFNPNASLPEIDDEYDADDFDDFHHSTDTGRRQAADAARADFELRQSESEKKRKLQAQEALRQGELAKLQFEELTEDLADPPQYTEPSSASLRIFAQTEICNSSGKRNDSRWLVVLLNGILRLEGKCEILFRSARQTFEHLQT